MKVEAEKMTEEFASDIAEVFNKHTDIPTIMKLAFVAANMGKLCRMCVQNPEKDLGGALALCIEFMVKGAGGEIVEGSGVHGPESNDPAPLN